MPHMYCRFRHLGMSDLSPWPLLHPAADKRFSVILQAAKPWINTQVFICVVKAFRIKVLGTLQDCILHSSDLCRRHHQCNIPPGRLPCDSSASNAGGGVCAFRRPAKPRSAIQGRHVGSKHVWPAPHRLLARDPPRSAHRTLRSNLVQRGQNRYGILCT
jgi:hypothetical protein